MRIVRQVLDRMPAGDYRIQDKKVTPPPRARIDESMEALIHHFKIFTEGFKVPEGEVYVAVESPRGELGCYIVSDGVGQAVPHAHAGAVVREHPDAAAHDARPPRRRRRGDHLVASTPSSETSTDEASPVRSPVATPAARTDGAPWPPDRRQRVVAREIIGRYPRPKSALIPLLHLAQEQDGYVTNDAMAHIAELVGHTPAEVYGTATFYEMFKFEPVGKYLDQHLRDDVVRAARRRGADAPRRGAPRHQGRRHHARRDVHAASTPSARRRAPRRRACRSTTATGTG